MHQAGIGGRLQEVAIPGAGADPLYKHLKDEAPGFLGGRIKWNFTKFLVDSSGKVVKRYAPTAKPEDIEKDVKKLLA